jgi:predicted TPR repeat methyltransferase
MAAAASGENVPGRASDEYVRDLFDQAAEKFDSKLEQLTYRAPALVAKALVDHVKTPLDSVLDAGCGTGLCGPLLREHCRQLSGVDLSAKMIEHARARACYDELRIAELSAFMESRPGAFEAVISADTLVYFGALEEPLRSVHETLRDSGWLIFTVEALVGSQLQTANEIESHRLEFHGRYSHSERYIRSALAEAGFTLEALTQETLRQELDRDVPGYLVVARRE